MAPMLKVNYFNNFFLILQVDIFIYILYIFLKLARDYISYVCFILIMTEKVMMLFIIEAIVLVFRKNDD